MTTYRHFSSIGIDSIETLTGEPLHNAGCVKPGVHDGTLSTVMKLMQMQSQMQVPEFKTRDDAYSSIGCSPQASCRHV